MAYNEATVQRIREVLLEKGVNFSEKKMFSGVCFMVDEKMCCGTHIDKKTSEEFLLCRVGDEAYATALEDPACIPMAFTGKPMKGYVFVLPDGTRTQANLARWLQLCLDFNPIAKRSKR